MSMTVSMRPAAAHHQISCRRCNIEPTWRASITPPALQLELGYILRDIVPNIYDGDHLHEDLAILSAEPSTKDDVLLLNAFLDEVSASADATWQLLKWHGTSHVSPYFNCKAITCFQEVGFNIYRIRPLRSRLQKYRVIYAFDNDEECNSIHILAVIIAVKSEDTPPPPELHYDYSKNHRISARVREEYESSGITKL